MASTFVTLSWNTSSSLSTGRGYILQVKRAPSTSDVTTADSNLDDVTRREEIVKQYEDIDVGLKMNSYTVTGLEPGRSYLFQLCLRKESYVITISSAVLTTMNSAFQSGLGIETDYVTLSAVCAAIALLAGACVTVSAVRFWRYRVLLGGGCGGRKRKGRGGGGGCRGGQDTLSQREMITSPSDHSSVTGAYAANGGGAGGVSVVARSISGSSSSQNARSLGGVSAANVAFGDQTRLMENEVASTVDERETIA